MTRGRIALAAIAVSVLAWCAAIARTVSPGDAVGSGAEWPWEYWGEREEVPQTGTVYPAGFRVEVGKDAEGRPNLDIRDDHGNYVDFSELDSKLQTAVNAMWLAIRASQAVSQLQMAVTDLNSLLEDEMDARVTNDDDLADRILHVRTVLANHMAAADDANVTSLLARVAITGKYGDLGELPALSEAEGDKDGFFFIVNRVPDGDGIPDESEDRPEYGYVRLAEVARTGAYDDLVFESPPVTTIVTYEGDSLTVYNVSVGAGGKLVFEQGGTINLDDDDDDDDGGEPCGCGWDGYDPADYLDADEIADTYETKADADAEHNRLDGRIDNLRADLEALESRVEWLESWTGTFDTEWKGRLMAMYTYISHNKDFDPSSDDGHAH